jgi:hypothetical protein
MIMTGQPLLRRCPHCGVDPGRVIDSLALLAIAATYLGGGSKRVIMPSLEYERGALDALKWALGIDQDGGFERHLRALERIRDQMAAESAKPTA